MLRAFLNLFIYPTKENRVLVLNFCTIWWMCLPVTLRSYEFLMSMLDDFSESVRIVNGTSMSSAVVVRLYFYDLISQKRRKKKQSWTSQKMPRRKRSQIWWFSLYKRLLMRSRSLLCSDYCNLLQNFANKSELQRQRPILFSVGYTSSCRKRNEKRISNVEYCCSDTKERTLQLKICPKELLRK